MFLHRISEGSFLASIKAITILSAYDNLNCDDVSLCHLTEMPVWKKLFSLYLFVFLPRLWQFAAHAKSLCVHFYRATIRQMVFMYVVITQTHIHTYIHKHTRQNDWILY